MANKIDVKEVEKYCNAVEKQCPREFRKRLMPDLESSISDYLAENPNSTLNNITQHFGEPEQFAIEYLAAMNDSERNKIISRAKWIKRGIAIGVALLIIIAAITATLIIIENSKTAVHYYSEEIIN